MSLNIHSSSPVVATGSPTATTASFTPPDGSLLLVAFSGNTDQGANPSLPTITDSLGSHLTYTISDRTWFANTGLDGQSAMWTAPVTTGASMTVSVTNNASSNRQSAIKVWVITGPHASPVGLHNIGWSSSASTISQNYTAQGSEGQGFLVSCDWNALGDDTAGTGCTLDGTGTYPTSQFSYAFEHRTLADDIIGGLNYLNLTLPSSSTNLSWCYIEILPAVGDPAEKDPPPFVQYFAPGSGPNRHPNAWLGTDNAAPNDTGLRISEASPALVTQTNGATTALITESFTPPAGSLVLALWSGNTEDLINPSTPTITDNLGTPLTYTLSDWQSHADSPTVNGQAAAWTAPVTTAVPMKVTVNNNAASNKQAALQVLVLINQNSTPVGAHGKAGSSSTAIITQSYTASATGGQGFIALADWTAGGTPKAGTDCFLADVGDAGTIPTNQLSFGMFKRTIPDDVNAVSNRLNVSLAATSTALAWVYIEILPVAVGSTQTVNGNGIITSEVLGTSTVSATYSINANGIVSNETIGNDTASPDAVTINGNGIQSTELSGTSIVTLNISPSGIVTNEVSGSAALVLNVNPSGITTSEVLGSSTTSATYTISGNGIPTSETLGNNVPTLSIQLSGITTSELLGTPTVSSTYSINANGIVTSEVVGNSITAQTISPNGITTGETDGSSSVTTTYTTTENGVTTQETLGTPRIDLNVSPSGVTSSEILGAPSVSVVVAINDSSIVTGESFGSTTITPGAVTVSASGIETQSVNGAPRIDLNVTPSGIITNESVSSPGVAQNVQTSGITSSETLGATTTTSLYTINANGIGTKEISGSSNVLLVQSVFVSSIQPAEALGSTSITVGPVTVSANGIASSESLGNNTLVSSNSISPNTINSSELLGSPTVSAGAATISPSGIITNESLGGPSLTITVGVNGIVSTERLGSPNTSWVVSDFGIVPGEVFGTPTITTGAVTVNANGIESNIVLGNVSIASLSPIPPWPDIGNNVGGRVKFDSRKTYVDVGNKLVVII